LLIARAYAANFVITSSPIDGTLMRLVVAFSMAS
jgi:hypothetical protein